MIYHTLFARREARPLSYRSFMDSRRLEGEFTCFETPAGTVRTLTPWRKAVEDHGIDPDAFDHRSMDETWDRMNDRDLTAYVNGVWGTDIDVQTVIGWRHGFFDRNVVWRVIFQDDYGLQPLAQTGFVPQVIVDVGGHVGTFTLLASSLWPDAKIVTIEPDMRGGKGRDTSQLLSMNTADRPNVTVEKSALIGGIDDSFPARVRHRRELSGDNRRHPLELSFLGSEEYGSWFEGKPDLRALSVNALLAKHAIEHIDLLKLDCEGSETFILRELRGLGMLDAIPEIRGEWHGNLAQREVQLSLTPSHRVNICVERNGTFGLFRGSAV